MSQKIDDYNSFYGLNLTDCEGKPTYADPEEDRGSGPSPLKNHKNIGFLSNTGPDPLKIYKAAKTAFNVGPSSAHQR